MSEVDLCGDRLDAVLAEVAGLGDARSRAATVVQRLGELLLASPGNSGATIQLGRALASRAGEFGDAVAKTSEDAVSG